MESQGHEHRMSDSDLCSYWKKQNTHTHTQLLYTMKVLHRKKAVYKASVMFKKAQITQELKGAKPLSKQENECVMFPLWD